MNSHVLRDLKIVGVNIPYDLALLSSQEIESLPTDGIPFDETAGLKYSEPVMVSGFPLGCDLRHKSATANYVEKLLGHIPPKHRKALAGRNSPNPQNYVQLLDGPIVPGHSGAPLINGLGRVIGVVDGGVESSENCWAVLIKGRFADPCGVQKR